MKKKSSFMNFFLIENRKIKSIFIKRKFYYKNFVQFFSLSLSKKIN